MACGIQIVMVNDVYEIDQWPAFSAAKKRAAKTFTLGPTIGVLPGDFVAPSLLSSLDKGNGMVDCMNAAGIDYVCIGNHESDIPLPNLHQRMRQSKFQWINSNMPDFPLPEGFGPLPVYEIIQLSSPSDPSHTRKVALLGLCGEDKSVMKPGAFGDCAIEPLLPKCQELVRHLVYDLGCDAVLPMTHELVQMDRDLAGSFDAALGRKVPFVLGGHDHEPFLEAVEREGYTCRIVKTGADGKAMAILTLSWESKADATPITTTATMLSSADVPDPDESVTQLVHQHKAILEEIERSVLCAIPPTLAEGFSSQGMRQHPTSVGTFLCTVMRDALQVDSVLVGAGSIRGNRCYQGEAVFSYAMLKAEMPFPTAIAIVDLPGSVVASMVSHTRAFALQTPPVEKGGYLQADDGLGWDSDSNTVTSLCGAPLDPDRIYSVGIGHGMLQGLDNVVPLLEFMKKCPPGHSVFKGDEAGHDAKELIVAHFSALMLYGLIQEQAGGIDKDGDGNLSKEEVTAALAASPTSPLAAPATRILVDNLFGIADSNGDGFISRAELVDFSLSCMLKISFSKRQAEDPSALLAVDDVMRDMMAAAGSGPGSVFGAAELEAVRVALAAVDVDGSGFISKDEYKTLLDASLKDKRVNI